LKNRIDLNKMFVTSELFVSSRTQRIQKEAVPAAGLTPAFWSLYLSYLSKFLIVLYGHRPHDNKVILDQ
ncbi:hypothetical protein L9F63_015392, partial [Diploptera punctata]